MKYQFNGKGVNIPDSEINSMMKNLELTQDEAIQLWLEDNDYLVNDELEELDAKAKKVKINHGAQSAEVSAKKKESKPKTVKVSDAKKEFFTQISTFLNDFCEKNGANVTVLKENKLFSIEYADEIFKLDLIQTRKSKK